MSLNITCCIIDSQFETSPIGTDMIKQAIAIAALIFASNAVVAADKDDLTLDINIASSHTYSTYIEDGMIKEFNEVNPGIGATYNITDRVSAKAGMYKNSFNIRSFYFGAAVEVFEIGDFIKLTGAVDLLLVSGYKNTPSNAPAYVGPLMPVFIPNLKIGTERVKLSVGLVPDTTNPTATLQLNYTFK